MKFFFFFLILGSAYFSHAGIQPEVNKYSVKIEPNFATKSVSGSTEIIFTRAVSYHLEFPLYGLVVGSVVVNKKAISFTQEDSLLKIDLSKIKKAKAILINYYGSPTKGLVWAPDYVYTNFDPCTWMICFTEPGVRATIAIDLNIPHTMNAVANGIEISANRWVESKPMASYLYGFAAGRFEHVSEKFENFELGYLGFSQTTDELKNKFKETAKVVKFFEEKSGVALPLKKYTQVLVPGTEAQEKQGFSILGRDFVDPILKDPTEDWVIVHELAHQWWGNMLPA